jgi:Cyclin, N-terminal domain
MRDFLPDACPELSMDSSPSEPGNGCIFDSDTLSYLISRESTYAPDPYYLSNKQSEVKWKMRAILLDWMCEVCSDYTLKRETYHYAINYVDRYLTVVPNVKKKKLQLIGVTALYMASKMEVLLIFQGFLKAI